jgi:HK97 family phage portal protein
MINFRSLVKTIFGPTADETSRQVLYTGSANWIPAPSDESSMKVSAVYSAVKLISEGVARLSLTLQRYNSATKCFVDDFDSGLYKALRVRPNEDLTAYEFWRACVQQMLLRGNAYILPSWNG